MTHPRARLRSVAFYLPQFHPIPENDRWWGTGYTEWRAVARARPLFAGHEQPDLPGELGFYDLRVPEVRRQQVQLARAGGIDAFCYYHYWFQGERLLGLPLDAIRESGEPDFPFCVCWANEDWRANWDGRSGEILIAQQYSADDDAAHGLWLAQLATDHRYLTVDGRPLVLVYRASAHPEPRRLTDAWRDAFATVGLPDPLLGRVASFPTEYGDPRALGFDVAIEFQPDWVHAHEQFEHRASARVLPYGDLVEAALSRRAPTWPRLRTVTPGWDNTPRRPLAPWLVEDATPERYCDWVRTVATEALASTDGETLLFVNAWNEWGEGAHLEPGERHGRDFLDAHRRGVADALNAPDAVAPLAPVTVATVAEAGAGIESATAPTHLAFCCNICSQPVTTPRASLDRDNASCPACGSSARMRGVIRAVSLALTGRDLTIDELPYDPEIRGIGLSDWDEYEQRLAARIDHTTTYFDREPRLDITNVPPELWGRYDLVIAADVFEHVAPPVSRAFEGALQLLKPGGHLVFSAPFWPEGPTREHYPDLHEFEVLELGNEPVLVNRTIDGRLEAFDGLVFHAGSLEVRLLSRDAILQHLTETGFVDVVEIADDVEGRGIIWPYGVSYPFIARRPR